MAGMIAGSLRRIVGWSLPVAFVAALFMVAGCGNSDQKAGAQVKVGEGEKKAQNSMEEFMKTQGKKAAPGKK